MPHIHDLYDFTTSAFVLHPNEDKLLLLKHRKIGKWLQPGGHIELNENPLQALRHELEEETGLTPEDWSFIAQPDQPKARGNTVLPIPFHFNEHNFDDTHKHIDLCYLVEAKTDKLTESPDGAEEIKWLGRAAIAEIHAAGDMFDGTFDICEWLFDYLATIRDIRVKNTA